MEYHTTACSEEGGPACIRGPVFRLRGETCWE